MDLVGRDRASADHHPRGLRPGAGADGRRVLSPELSQQAKRRATPTCSAVGCTVVSAVIGCRATRTTARTTTAAGSRGTSPPLPGLDHLRTVYVRESAIVPKLDEWIATLFAPENLDETCQALAEAGGAADADHARIEAVRRKLADCDRRPSGYQKTLDAGADPVIVAGWISQVQGERLWAERDLSAAQPSGRLTARAGACARGRLEGHCLRAGRR